MELVEEVEVVVFVAVAVKGVLEVVGVVVGCNRSSNS